MRLSLRLAILKRILSYKFSQYKPNAYRLNKLRENSLQHLNVFSSNKLDACHYEKVLVDFMWDNANYYIRYSLFRSALGLDKAKEFGLIGEFSRDKCKKAIDLFEFDETLDYKRFSRIRQCHYAQASSILSNVLSNNQLLDISLPEGFPASYFYDFILLQQRTSSVQVTDPNIKYYLAKLLANLEGVKSILTNRNIDCVVLSQCLGITFGPIAWIAIQMNIPVFVLHGDKGLLNFYRMTKPDDLFRFLAVPSRSQLDSLPDAITEKLKSVGEQQLYARVSGKTADISAEYAYRMRKEPIDRQTICELYDWNPQKPIIGIYNSNWFDYPHASGLDKFRDFEDWIRQTLEVALVTQDVNWLFKAHPCDEWYGVSNSSTLENIVLSEKLHHIKMVDTKWNSAQLMKTFDGIITCHGTIGVEASAMGIPVLIPYDGWYGHAGFTVNSYSAEDYLRKLAQKWWLSTDISTNSLKAKIFMSFLMSAPQWQKHFLFIDDSKQDSIYKTLIPFLESNMHTIKKEIASIRLWHHSREQFYHVYKMINAESFMSVNP